MKIVYVVETYTEGLGYIDNILPLELGALGNDVHLITCNLPAYYNVSMAFFGKLTGKKTFYGEKTYKGIKIHTCPYIKVGNRILIKGLKRKIKEIEPDIVVVRGIASPVLGQVILAKFASNFALFTSTGQAYSALPVSLTEGKLFSRAKVVNFFTRVIPGRLFSYFIIKCIGSTVDCVDVVIRFYGIPKGKTVVVSLGVDTNIFYPVRDKQSQQKRVQMRKKLGIEPGQILCIWTGRMTKKKALPVLAKAIEELNNDGYEFKVLFIGSGPISQDLKAFTGTIVQEILPWNELPDFYRAADIAIWPKSITTSTLDASACGVPVIMSDKELATERWEGIGAIYEEGNVESLKMKLLEYIDQDIRLSIGSKGALRMESRYSWKKIARQFEAVFFNGIEK